MIIFKKAADLKKYLQKSNSFPSKTGFVPTMGALHEGHLRLLEKCRAQMDISVVSIFVNPTQFNDPSDFTNYPVTIDRDIFLLEKAGCDVLFLPSVEEVYDKGIAEQIHYDLGRLETLLEGFYRPGHFQGVSKVMDKLLHIVQADHLYMGSKDYQQCMVIRRMLDILGLPCRLNIVDTVREADGLAMSSRNLRLNESERQIAANIYNQFRYIMDNIENVSISELQQKAGENLLKAGFSKVDYVAVADSLNLEPLINITKGTTARVLIAAYLNQVRLIDNMEITA